MIGIVVVTYNSGEVIEGCLEACRKAVPHARVLVVDNASADDTVERVKRWTGVELLANRTNRGFAGGVNQGIAALDCPAVLILNPDALPTAGIDVLERMVERPGVGAATGRLVGSDAQQQHGFNIRALPTPITLIFEVLGVNRLWPGNPVNRQYRQRTPDTATQVEQPAGAFLMLKRSAWAELGGFDESFFPIWFEDVDYCKRLRDQGYQIWFVPEAVARHQGGHSAGKLLWGERQRFWYGSLLKYASKHFSGVSRAALCMAVILGCVPRAVFGIWHVGVAQAASVFGTVVCLTGQSLRKGERGRNTPANSVPVEEQFKQSR
jgi:N-acetylglucosaminyl-diphospho-decaprenol L-rhamnosyltransferase